MLQKRAGFPSFKRQGLDLGSPLNCYCPISNLSFLLKRLSKSFGITDSALLWFHSFLTDALSLLFLVPPLLTGFTSRMAYPKVRSLLSFCSFFIPQIYQRSCLYYCSAEIRISEV